jgi:hypothetical protein
MVITGSSNSRLSELKKYTITNVFSNQYFTNGSVSNDGIDLTNSIQNQLIIYYIGGIQYTDTIISGVTTTTFMFNGLGLSSPDFISGASIIKDYNKDDIISYPQINNDVFIIRQDLSAFELNYKLEFIKKLVDLETYAGGKFFNVVNNT